ncbi:hypothetical protein [Dehalobacter sp. TeCB1]|jgi:protein-arginine kinase activator protein McsA|uniref:hypothetical protein n=1 Tax=Dehalobacter sp. TeCB1 TaxID=1843715 RepID=UPI001146B4ED|nr:hypothetical protein [Dehalobacter sp. TeCB1]
MDEDENRYELKYCEKCQSEAPHYFHFIDCSQHETSYWICNSCGTVSDYERIEHFTPMVY